MVQKVKKEGENHETENQTFYEPNVVMFQCGSTCVWSLQFFECKLLRDRQCQL